MFLCKNIKNIVSTLKKYIKKIYLAPIRKFRKVSENQNTHEIKTYLSLTDITVCKIQNTMPFINSAK